MSSSSVLVVDDDLDTCQNMADVLGELGYNVDTATDGQTGLQLVRGKVYDVAILDLKMPGMDGLTLFAEIHKLSATTVALLVTGFASTEASAAALNLGFRRVVSKPVDFATFLPDLARAMEKSVSSAKSLAP